MQLNLVKTKLQVGQNKFRPRKPEGSLTSLSPEALQTKYKASVLLLSVAKLYGPQVYNIAVCLEKKRKKKKEFLH